MWSSHINILKFSLITWHILAPCVLPPSPILSTEARRVLQGCSVRHHASAVKWSHTITWGVNTRRKKRQVADVCWHFKDTFIFSWRLRDPTFKLGDRIHDVHFSTVVASLCLMCEQTPPPPFALRLSLRLCTYLHRSDSDVSVQWADGFHACPSSFEFQCRSQTVCGQVKHLCLTLTCLCHSPSSVTLIRIWWTVVMSDNNNNSNLHFVMWPPLLPQSPSPTSAPPLHSFIYSICCPRFQNPLFFNCIPSFPFSSSSSAAIYF